MPTLTPIPLTIEEHERLVAMKHRLETGSWREMIMKLCDFYEETLKTEQPKKPAEQETKPEPKESPLTNMFSHLGKEGEKQMNEEDIRRIIREELQDHKFEVELPKPEKPKEKTRTMSRMRNTNKTCLEALPKLRFRV